MVPCPFCPQPDVLTLVVETEFVSCTKCGCQGPIADGYSEAIDNWNAQPRTPEAQSLADALGEALGLITESYTRPSMEAGYWPTVKPIVERLDAALAAWEKAVR